MPVAPSDRSADTSRVTELHDLLRRAGEFRDAGDFGEEAAGVYRRLSELQPSAPGPYVMLATCHERAGRWREARETYQRALALPDRGRFDRRIRNGLKRARAGERVARLDDFAEALRVAGLAHESGGDPDLALVASGRALELAATREQETAALARRAAILRTLGRPEEALGLLRYSLELDSSREANTASYACLVACLTDLGRTAEAKIEGERLLRALPGDPWVLSALGAAYARLHRETGDPRWQAAAESCLARVRGGGPRPR